MENITENNKLIVSELLTFIQNSIRTMSTEAIVMVCSSTFSWYDIEKAEEILRKISKKPFVKNKEDFDYYDLIEVVKSFDKETGPIFVAQYLNKLPKAVTSSALLKKNSDLHKENEDLKKRMASIDKYFAEVSNIPSKTKINFAKYSYTAAGKDEVSFNTGDIIYNLDNGYPWFRGTILRTGETGLIPANYVVLYMKDDHEYIYVL